VLCVEPAWVIVDAKKAAEDAVEISVEGDAILPKSNAGDGGSGVAADAGQEEQVFFGGGHLSSQIAYHPLRGFVKVAGTSIVAKAFPGLEYVVYRSICQGVQVGESGEKGLVVIEYRLDPCLLKHDLRHPDGIRVAGMPPREVTAFTFVPVQQSLADDCRILSSVNARERCHGLYYTL
jgi:hypothetical protein